VSKSKIIQAATVRASECNKKYFAEIDEIDEPYWAQAGGMADGDGYLPKKHHKHQMVYELKMKDREPVQWLADVYGTTISRITYDENWEDCYKTVLHGKRALHFMLKVCPYLVEKRKEATRIINIKFPNYHPPKIPMTLDNMSKHMGYIAGFFDAEGSVQCRYKRTKDNHDIIKQWVTITNTDIRPLKKIQQILTSKPFSWTKKDVTIYSHQEKKIRLKDGGEKKLKHVMRFSTKAQITFMAIFQPIIQIKRKANIADKLKTLRSIDIFMGKRPRLNVKGRPVNVTR